MVPSVQTRGTPTLDVNPCVNTAVHLPYTVRTLCHSGTNGVHRPYTKALRPDPTITDRLTMAYTGTSPKGSVPFGTFPLVCLKRPVNPPVPNGYQRLCTGRTPSDSRPTMTVLYSSGRRALVYRRARDVRPPTLYTDVGPPTAVARRT